VARLKASDFPPEVLKLFDGYVHGWLSRRDFLDKAGKYAVGGFTATAMLESLRPNYALAQQVPKNDPRIAVEYLTYPSPQGSGTMKGYFARPAGAGKWPGIVVIHENRGLNPYIEDVARRLATDGFVAFAPDALAPLGGYPGDEEKAAQMFGTLDAAKRTEDLMAAYAFLKSRPECTGKVGAVGFCFGGGVVNQMAVRFPDLAAAVPFYGGQPSAADAAKIKAPLMLQYAGLDERINAGWPAYEAALKANNVKYQAFVYPNTNHGFHNDTTPRYDEAAAKLAWSRTGRLLQGKPEGVAAATAPGEATDVRRHRQALRGSLPDRADALHRRPARSTSRASARSRLHDRPGGRRHLHSRELLGAVPADRRRRATLLDVCMTHVGGRVPVIVTCSHFSTRIASERARAAAAAGAADADADASLPWRDAPRRRKGARSSTSRRWPKPPASRSCCRTHR
jgi:carboxymethylenebutenolidase